MRKQNDEFFKMVRENKIYTKDEFIEKLKQSGGLSCGLSGKSLNTYQEVIKYAYEKANPRSTYENFLEDDLWRAYNKFLKDKKPIT
jgi:hypothetical protein